MKSILNSYFTWKENTLDKLNLKNVLAWISGHTHWSYNIQKNGCSFIANQLGYKSEIGKKTFITPHPMQDAVNWWRSQQGWEPQDLDIKDFKRWQSL